MTALIENIDTPLNTILYNAFNASRVKDAFIALHASQAIKGISACREDVHKEVLRINYFLLLWWGVEIPVNEYNTCNYLIQEDWSDLETIFDITLQDKIVA